jgi:electron transfer flavoprotein alpha subunit
MSDNAIVVVSWGSGRDGLPAGAEEILTLGRKLAGELGSELSWLTLGPAPERLEEAAGAQGASSLERIEDPKLEAYAPDALVSALAQYCEQRSPRALLFVQNEQTRLVAPRVAGRVGAGVVTNAIDIEPAGADLRVTATAYGGDTHVGYELTGASTFAVVVNTTSLVAEPAEAASGPSTETVSVDLSSVQERFSVTQSARSEGPKLEDAEIIVSGGRGLGSPDNYKLITELAEALGGLAGASRPIVDEGWVDSAQQVGLTGKITRPALYIAAGISGASQHMAGCAAAKTIVAINRDEAASIFRYARYGIVGDCLEILPELIKAAKTN